MIWFLAVGVIVIAVALYDLTQRHHAILRTFPIIGHFRYWLEAVGSTSRSSGGLHVERWSAGPVSNVRESSHVSNRRGD